MVLSGIVATFPSRKIGKAAYAGGLLAAASWGFVLGLDVLLPSDSVPRDLVSELLC